MATMYLQTYWLPGEERTNSITGKITKEDRGPFCVCAQGCAWKPLTEAEVREYVFKMHGTYPTKIETTTSNA